MGAFSQPQPAAAGSSPAAAAGQPPAAPINFRAGLTSKRGRGYVDVLSQSGMSKPVSGPAMVPNGAPPSSSMAPPAMLTPSGPVPSQDGPSSLTTPATADDGPSSMPMMFNPSSMSTASMPPNSDQFKQILSTRVYILLDENFHLYRFRCPLC